jgi:hypothetical protein
MNDLRQSDSNQSQETINAEDNYVAFVLRHQ